LVAELHAQGIVCSARRLEDWARVGLVPRGRRKALGRGRGTEVVYPDDMAERSRQVAQRMRRGQPWQVVALSLFGAGADLPEDTIRAAYSWALAIELPLEVDELETAEGGIDQMLSTLAGRRLQLLIAAHVKRSGVAPGESPSVVARSVLTNLMLVPLGGEVASDQAMVEVLAGMGVPIGELPPDERIQAARFIDAVISVFSFDELARVVEQVSIDDLRTALPIATGALEMLPADLSAFLPRPILELLPALLAPVIVQLGRIAESLLADPQVSTQSQNAP
jgi:hypothetical protein